jgi:hypothetical protein
MFRITDLIELIQGAGQWRCSLLVGFKESFVGGNLIPTNASLFVDEQFLGPGCKGYRFVGSIDAANRAVRARDLPHQDCGEQKAGNDRQHEHLPKSSFKPS